MLNLGALDVVIAMVVVLIVLSLVVQSIQQLVKKIFKLKSKIILGSLEDLLGKVMKVDAAAARNAGTAACSPAAPATNTQAGLRVGLRNLLSGFSSKVRSVDTSVNEVLDELKALGRRSLFNRPMLDSIAKDDIVKVMTRLGATKLSQQNFQEIREALRVVVETLEAARTASPQGSSSAKLASLQQALTPLVTDLKDLTTGTGVLPTTVLNDLLNLRQIRLHDAFDLLGEVQDRVQQDLTAAAAAGRDTAALTVVDTKLRAAANQLKELGDQIEAAVAPLAAKLSAVELWYDTVMQGFSERYTRHMKTVGVGIAILTVIALNANFFILYSRIVTDPKLRERIVTQGAKIDEANRKKQKEQVTPSETPSSTPAPQESTTPPAPEPSVKDVQQAGQDVARSVQAYEGLGFSRLHWSDVKNFWYEDAPWGPGTAKGSGPWLGEGLTTLFGWLLTILLVSAGAPFWEDVLESLFGLKSLMRQKTGTKNVEETQGGQTKP